MKSVECGADALIAMGFPPILLMIAATHVQDNTIERISGLDTLQNLSVLNLTSNKISTVQVHECVIGCH